MDVRNSCNLLFLESILDVKPVEDIVNTASDDEEDDDESQPCPLLEPCPASSQYSHGLDTVIGGASTLDSDEKHKLRVAPILSCAVHSIGGFQVQKGLSLAARLPQFGVLGLQQELSVKTSTEQRLQKTVILNNIEEPSSTFICGSQGSGKSHTLSCLLENSLLPNTMIGDLNRTPLTGLVFHYDKFSGYNVGQVCESAYLSSANVRVKVLVAPTSLKRMRRQYSNLPHMPESAPRPAVMPLYFSEHQISVDMMMTLMAVHNTGVAAPLYISTIRQILREIALARQDDPGFDYAGFRHRLADLTLDQGQCTPLNLRLELLESFLLAREQSDEALRAFEETWRFEPGTLTIIDLSDQFVNEADACALFSICLKLFMDGWRSNPRIVVLDEAHKFLGNTTEASKLTNDLVSIIRQQRHLNSRVVIATQEPTLAGDLLDLCNVSIIHRFSSPKWYDTIKAHIAGAHSKTAGSDGLFQRIINLQTGEAMVSCPTAVLMDHAHSPKVLGSEVIWLKVRPRISADGGKSVRATDKFSIESVEVSSSMPTFVQLNGKSLPQPGSSAGKTYKKGKPSTAATITKQSARRTEPAQQVQPASSTLASNSTSLGDYHSDTAAASPISIIAAATGVTSDGQGPWQEVSQAFLDERLQTELLRALQSHPTLYAQKPQPHIKAILRAVSVQCNLPSKYLKANDVVWNGELVKPTAILKCYLKQYCDSQGIPFSQRANLGWLR